MKDLSLAVEILKIGGVVVYPTDTAYGLAVDATNPFAVKKLYAVKGRDFKNPVHVIPPSKAWIAKIVKLNPTAKKLIEALMPGALTLVLPLKAVGTSWKALSAGTKTMGIRRPDNKVALDLATLLGKPITTTSANLSGQATCYSISEVQKQFNNKKFQPDYYLDGGKLKKLKPSTVVLVGEDYVRILREGPITEQEIQSVLNK